MEKQDIILHVDHMTKCFGDLKVLNDISFDEAFHVKHLLGQI